MTHKTGFFAALFSAVAWSTTGIFVRFLNGFSSLEIVAGRCLIGLLFIVLFFGFRHPGLSKKILISKQAWFLGLLMAGYFLLVVTAYQIAPVAEVAILTNTTPLFAIFYKRLKGLLITSKQVWGVLLGMIGVILVVISGTSSNPDSANSLHLIGDLMALIAGAAMAIYSIFYNTISLVKKPSSQVATFFTFLIGSLVSLFIIGMSDEMFHMKHLLDSNAIYFILALGIFATLLPTLCYSYASSVLASITVTSLRLLTPLFAAFLGILFFNEIPNVLFWPGALILFIGLYLIIKEK
ncbi:MULTISPECIES: DMT family transporter [Mesonia]|uniref:Uncharacterized protein n=1 Tax=Mesonia oceanica TaxID=2687242 RepID=A0AC61YDG5_9FLAO|nr:MULTISPECIES: DMT family transporter [Mesonia]VVV02448.1 hypothetical protein FVB9532_03747 [Mesonia oceanica]|tara:strand:+ start:18597 stop:19481 length:885 start_codon:yes stop_codon:yes gene_type:complete